MNEAQLFTHYGFRITDYRLRITHYEPRTTHPRYHEHHPTNLEAKNTAALFAAQFAVSILSLALSIFIAWSLGDVIFGKYSFALAFTAIFAVFSDLGYNTLLIREVARDKSQASKYQNNVLCMRALISLVIFALIVITINLMGYPADTKNVVYLFGIYTLIISLSAVFKVTFRAFEKMNLEDVCEGERILL